MVGSKRLYWTPEMDNEVRSMLRKGIPKAVIAKNMGIHRVQLLRRIARLDEVPEPLIRKGFTPPDHVEKFNRVRRGFHVPAHLEAAYFDLLKQGVSIDEARRRLKIHKD